MLEQDKDKFDFHCAGLVILSLGLANYYDL